jgi:hypothetical protein
VDKFQPVVDKRQAENNKPVGDAQPQGRMPDGFDITGNNRNAVNHYCGEHRPE